MQVRILRHSADGLPWRALWQSLRPHQWAKSLLVFAPLAAAHQLHDWQLLLRCSIAFLAFCMMASGLYLINDLLDRERDGQHPTKCTRPVTAGTVPAPVAVFSALALCSVAIGIAGFLSVQFLLWVLLYAVLVVSYSLRLKHLMGADLIALTSFYVLRIQAGGSAILIQPSAWLLSFAACLFLSLAVLKRYQDLRAWHDEDQGWPLSCQQYAAISTRQLGLLGLLSASSALLILATYLGSPTAASLYPNMMPAWCLPFLLAAWLLWMWRQAMTGRMGEDPVLLALSRPTSQLLLATMGLAVALAATP